MNTFIHMTNDLSERTNARGAAPKRLGSAVFAPSAQPQSLNVGVNVRVIANATTATLWSLTVGASELAALPGLCASTPSLRWTFTSRMPAVTTACIAATRATPTTAALFGYCAVGLRTPAGFTGPVVEACGKQGCERVNSRGSEPGTESDCFVSDHSQRDAGGAETPRN